MRVFAYAPVLALASMAVAAPVAQVSQPAGDLAPAKLQLNATENAVAAPQAYNQQSPSGIDNSNQDQSMWGSLLKFGGQFLGGLLGGGGDSGGDSRPDTIPAISTKGDVAAAAANGVPAVKTVPAVKAAAPAPAAAPVAAAKNSTPKSGASKGSPKGGASKGGSKPRGNKSAKAK